MKNEASRGTCRGEAAKAAGFELAATGDTWEERLKKFGEEKQVTTYMDYDKFMEHAMMKPMFEVKAVDAKTKSA